MASKDQDFVEYVVKAFVDHPEDVKTERKVDEMGVLLLLTVNPADMGQIIGKEGRTAKALRTLLRVLGAKENARINLKIVEPNGKEVKVSEEKKEEKKEEKEEEKKEEKKEEKEEEKETTELPKIEV